LHKTLYLDQNHINETIKNFFSCTHLPIKFYASNHTAIASYGYNENSNCLVEEYNIYKKIKESLRNNPFEYETLIVEEDINFTGFFACPKNKDKGIYILGPYVTDQSKITDIVFKPKKFIPNLISFLHGIAKTCDLLESHHLEGISPQNFYVKRAVDYMYENYKETINLDTLAKKLNVNKCYLCSLFRKEANKTFSQFLNEIRIEKSKGLLVEGDSSILDIALNVGFNNQNYYNMTFKKLTGFTPLEYRNYHN